MKFSFFYLFCIVSIASQSFANDSRFYENGSNIYPIKETNIELRKEVLKINRNDYWVDVNVTFHFYNPSKKTKKVLMGFVTPFPRGDIGDPTKPTLKNFTAIVNDSQIKYKIKTHVDDEGEEIDYMTTGTFTYLFSAKFRPGMNIVKHTYSIPTSGYSTGTPQMIFNYILQTAKSWANGRIDDFELRVGSKSPSIFFLQQGLDSNSTSWNIEGIGKENPFALNHPWNKKDCLSINRIFAMQSGHIVFRAKNFVPQCDLQIGWASDIIDVFNEFAYDEIEFVGGGLDSISLHYLLYKNSSYSDDEIPDSLSMNDIMVLRQIGYAAKGYIFTDTAIQHLYEKMYWYFPNPSFTESVKNGVKSDAYFYHLGEKEKALMTLIDQQRIE
ncbi:MAG: DUF4424 family protein [Ignavibacteriae bacterium]|nr:DUF4424 family protein [Ignavibacteriota bacterium]